MQFFSEIHKVVSCSFEVQKFVSPADFILRLEWIEGKKKKNLCWQFFSNSFTRLNGSAETFSAPSC